MSVDRTLTVLTQDDIALDRLVRGAAEHQECGTDATAPQPTAVDSTSVETIGAQRRDDDRPFGTSLDELDWIDEFVAGIRPYVRVRIEDSVLIKLPLEVYRLNRAGLLMLERALRGERTRQIAIDMRASQQADRLYQIHTFFCDVRDLLQNRIGDGRGRPTTRVSTFEGSYTKYPVLSEIAVTYRCNLACSFCYAGCGTSDANPGNAARERHRNWWKLWRNSRWWRRRHAPRDPIAQEMTAAEVLRVIDELADVGRVPSVSFTGGECTLRPELPRFISHARRRQMRVNIITNGIICSSRTYVEKLAAAGLTSAQVSLSGPRPDIHDALAQRRGAFDQAVQGIVNLRDAGLHVHTNTTICEENAEHLCDIVDLALRLKLPHVSMNQIIPTGSSNLARHARIKTTYSRIGEYVLKAKEHADKVGIAFHWYSPTPFCIFNPIAHGLGNKGCAACDGLIHVSPSGEVLPCSSFARGVGNLLEKGFPDVWFGKDALYYKKQTSGPCDLPSL